MWERLKNTNRYTLAALAVIPALVAFVAANLIISVAFEGARIDLTEDNIYTVSPATEALLESIEEPVTIRLFLSSSMVESFASIRPFADRIEELLETFEHSSDGMVRFVRVDPEPFSTEEDQAIAYNLISFNVNRADEQGFFGIVGTNTLDQIEVIPALFQNREALLEFDMARMVARLASPTEPKIGVFDSLALFGSTALGREPSAVIERLGRDYEVERLDADITAIPDDIDALVIIHPHSLSENALYAVDQYAIRGGPILVFLDTFAQSSPPRPNNPAEPEFPQSTLAPVLAAWGVDLIEDLVVGDVNMAMDIRAQAGDQIVVSPYPPFLDIEQAHLNPDDPITDRLSTMRIVTAGALRPLESAESNFIPLIATTTESMLYERAIVQRRTPGDELLAIFQPSGVNYVLAARIEGTIQTAFPDGAPPVPEVGEGEDPLPEPPELIATSETPASIVVVGDVDMIVDALTVNSSTGAPINQNLDFVSNAVDSLLGASSLTQLRGRGVVNRPFTRVDEFEAEAEQRFRARELELQAELDQVEAQLAEVRGGVDLNAGDLGVLTREQQELVDTYNQTLVELRFELREVQSALREELDTLTTRLLLLNILAVPAVIVLIGLAGWLIRRAWVSRHVRAFSNKPKPA